MKRKHLFEFEDQRWFPGFLRNYLTDFLQFVSNKFTIYKGIVPLLSETLTKSGNSTIIDLASGGGGGLINLVSELEKDHPEIQVVLTDLYPNEKAFAFTSKQSGRFSYKKESVDATNVPSTLVGLRTQFLSLHHFREEDAVKILQNAVDATSAIALFESQERNVKSVISMILSPLNVLFVTPLIRPFSIGRIVFTYLIPLVPLFVMLDGILSALRTYTVPEMEELVSRVKGNENYDWKIGKVKSGPATILYLVGTPKH
ncbi:hypothetical protein D3C87_464390 [compost metagenome]